MKPKSKRFAKATRDVRSALDAALALKDDVAFVDALMDIVGREYGPDHETLALLLKAVVDVNAFSLEVNSGGLYQVFANSSPRVLEGMKNGLNLIGANRTGELLEAICEEFPGGTIPDAAPARFQILDALEAGAPPNVLQQAEHAYRGNNEDVLALLRRFVLTRKEDIVAAFQQTRDAGDQ